ncbi:MAG: Gfo/Idh/MocA family oxidoreductase [Candidatus Rokubacteria bacterium]|nr:Gfo/Idh/MocA family oxidoreductase [Candidatus Rokubacteria bacterium]
MAHETIRVGMIGAGYISAYHLAGLAAAGGADVRVLMSRTPARAAVLARRFGIPEVVTDYRAVLDRPDIDAVVIATPDDTHEEIAVAAAAAGKAILLQKPMAGSSAACRRIIGAARRAGVDLQVSFMHRYFEEVVRTRELLAGDKLGPVLAVRVRNATPGPDWNDWFFSRERVPGGVVHQLGVHGIDLLRHVIGEIGAVVGTVATLRQERVLADGRTVRPENEDHALALYRFRGGALGTHEMSLSEIQGCDRFRLEVYGAEATIWLRTERGPLAVYAPALTGARGWFVPALPTRAFGERQHAHWLGILRGQIPSERTAEDGLATLLVAEALYRAAAARREEPVPDLDAVLEAR